LIEKKVAVNYVLICSDREVIEKDRKETYYSSLSTTKPRYIPLLLALIFVYYACGHEFESLVK